jgi:hypothetical protein
LIVSCFLPSFLDIPLSFFLPSFLPSVLQGVPEYSMEYLMDTDADEISITTTLKRKAWYVLLYSLCHHARVCVYIYIYIYIYISR